MAAFNFFLVAGAAAGAEPLLPEAQGAGGSTVGEVESLRGAVNVTVALNAAAAAAAEAGAGARFNQTNPLGSSTGCGLAPNVPVVEFSGIEGMWTRWDFSVRKIWPPYSTSGYAMPEACHRMESLREALGEMPESTSLPEPTNSTGWELCSSTNMADCDMCYEVIAVLPRVDLCQASSDRCFAARPDLATDASICFVCPTSECGDMPQWMKDKTAEAAKMIYKEADSRTTSRNPWTAGAIGGAVAGVFFLLACGGSAARRHNSGGHQHGQRLLG
jgi:hypothetical protein